MSIVSGYIPGYQREKLGKSLFEYSGSKGYRECHIQPDWLLIYRIEGNELQLIETGSHADLFG